MMLLRQAFTHGVSGTPPATPVDPLWDNVAMLMHMDGSAGSTAFDDEKGNVVTNVGSVITATATKKIGDGSADFALSTHQKYLSLPVSVGSFIAGTGTADFTVELWMLPVENAGGVYYCIMSAGPPFQLYYLNGQINLYVSDSATTGNYVVVNNLLTTGTAIPINEWTHVAVERSVNTYSIFINGTQRGFVTNTNPAATPVSYLTIGAYRDAPSPAGSPNGIYYFGGFMDEIRITKGLTRYNGNFIPPTAPFLNGPPPEPLPAVPGTVFLTHADGANGSTIIIDEKGHTITVGGTSNLNTLKPKFGTASISTTTTAGSFATISGSPNLNLPGDFTIEGWFKPWALGNNAALISHSTYATAGNGTFIIAINMGRFRWVSYNGLYTGPTASEFLVDSAPITISLGAWHHIAVTRTGTIIRGFVDGVQVIESAGETKNINADGSALYVGSGYANTNFDGFVDELRIIKGTALYTANFTVPAGPFSV